jgi:hypothetical protein
MTVSFHILSNSFPTNIPPTRAMQSELQAASIYNNGEAVPVLNQAARHDKIWESEGITPRILNLSKDGVSGLLHAPVTVSPQKEPRYPMGRSLDGPPRQSEHCGVDNICLVPAGNETCHYID